MYMQSYYKHGSKFTVKEIAVVAMLAAILILAKLVIFYIPNVEIVTLLIVCFATVFKPRDTLLAVLAFCICDIFIYGFRVDVTILYLFHYPLLAICAHIVSRLTIRNIFAMMLLVAVFATMFWLETPLILSLIAMDFSKFGIYTYLGISFYIANICSVGASMLLYPVVCRILEKSAKAS